VRIAQEAGLRYRLRFHLQEVDLGGDEVVMGRGSMCHVTIDDPMLSRRHVRIDLTGAKPTIEDLRSRNGRSSTDARSPAARRWKTAIAFGSAPRSWCS
jgi:hypothetical protein